MKIVNFDAIFWVLAPKFASRGAPENFLEDFFPPPPPFILPPPAPDFAIVATLLCRIIIVSKIVVRL